MEPVKPESIELKQSEAFTYRYLYVNAACPQTTITNNNWGRRRLDSNSDTYCAWFTIIIVMSFECASQHPFARARRG